MMTMNESRARIQSQVRSQGQERTLSAPLLLVSAVLWMLSIFADWFTHRDALSCELSPGSSVYGEPGWSWLPVGHTCTWPASAGLPAITEGPSWLTMVPAALLLLWGMAILIERGKESSARVA